MPIICDDAARTFTIHTRHTTYQMQVDRFGYLLHLYYGAKTEGTMDYLLDFCDRGTSGCPHDAGDERTYSLDFLPQEYPVMGTGDLRSPVLVVRDANGAYGCDLRYAGHEVRPGKYALRGLPAAYSDCPEDGAETLCVLLRDERLGLEVELLYGVLPEVDVVCRAAVIRNAGSRRRVVEKAPTACLDLLHGSFDLLSLHGRHGMEHVAERCEVGHRSYVVSSRRGSSSHQQNPFLALMDHDATETSGRCWAMEFVYSGGFKGECELTQYEQTRMQLGLDDEQLSYPLMPGEELVAPEVLMTYSGEGLGTLSDNLHRCVAKHVCRGYWRDRPRPVLINSWEAFGFDFDGDRLIGLATRAKQVGAELFVLDDGWFANRCDDCRSLGDWRVNEEKLGGTLSQLIAAINDVGLMFGIWVEPEMVNEDSDLYRAHPDWAFAIPGKAPVLARNQLVLDFSRPEVCDEVFSQLCAVLDQGPVDYVKWDYNRPIVDVFSRTAVDQGKVLYDFVLGVYSVLERLHERYPHMLIEGCAGGGGRFDAGMLYYTPQIWCSDNTDAIDRLAIQHGTSFAYPCSTVGAHVSACPNAMTRRTTPLHTRAVVAEAGTFGYELDLAELSSEELDAVAEQIRWHHRVEWLVRTGRYHRLSDPADAVCAWEQVARDGSAALVSGVVTGYEGYGVRRYVTPRGLVAGALYRDSQSGAVYPADALMSEGLRVPCENGDYQAFSILLERV